MKVVVSDGYPSDWENKAGMFGTIFGKIKQGCLEYESMLEKIDVQKKINDAMLQMKNNEVIDGKDFLKELKDT